jgi:hypothetical protein
MANFRARASKVEDKSAIFLLFKKKKKKMEACQKGPRSGQRRLPPVKSQTTSALI